MGVFGALNTAVSGLSAQAFALENISGNIANSQTTGFRRQDTAFFELVSDGGASQAVQNSGAVSASSRATTDIQGNIIGNQEQDTFIAINGDGFFAVEQATGFVNGSPQFEGSPLFTRAGDFQLSSGGFLQNGAGLFLNGFPILGGDAVVGAAGTLSAQPIQVSTEPLAPVATTEIDLSANLPIFPSTEASVDGDPASGLLDATLIQTPDPLASPAILPATGLAEITFAQESLFLDTSIPGGSTTVLDARGVPTVVEFRFAQTDTATAPVNGTDTYNLYFRSAATGGATDTAFTRVDQQFIFDASGQLNPPVTGVELNNFTINGNLIGDVNLDTGGDGFTQVSDQSGTGQVSNATISSNGTPIGIFDSVAVNDGGLVSVSYSNGATVNVAQIAVVTFANTAGLERVDGGGTFAQTVASGAPISDASSSGSIIGSALEASNVDIADEFTNLIVTQQAYTANSRIITTADELLSEAINIIR